MRSDRLLATLLLLQTHGRLPAPDIARRLEVSTRTVHRDVDALSSAGVPVYTERGRRGGVVLLEGYRTDVTGMTDEEMRALLVLGGSDGDERGPGPALGPSLGPALASAVRKLMAAVPASRREDLDRARQRLLVEQRGWHARSGPDDDVPALPALEAALVDDERLRLRYASAGRGPGGTPTGDPDGAGTWRTVDPYGLVCKGGVWYLVAAHRGSPRMYRVSRVREVAVTGVPARRPDDRTLAEVWAQLRDRLESLSEAVEVRLRVRRAWHGVLVRIVARQLVGPPREEPDDPAADDGWAVLTAPFRAVGAARGALLGFGDAVEVLDPPALRAELLATAASVVALYRPDGPDRPDG